MTHSFIDVTEAPVQTATENAYLKPAPKIETKPVMNSKNYLDKDDEFDELIRTLESGKMNLSAKNNQD